MHERDGQTREVGHIVVEQLGRLIHAFLEAAVADALRQKNISNPFLK